MVVYGIYNLETLEKLINTVHKMHNNTTPNENLFVGKLNSWDNWYLNKEPLFHKFPLIFEKDNRKIFSNVHRIHQSVMYV